MAPVIFSRRRSGSGGTKEKKWDKEGNARKGKKEKKVEYVYKTVYLENDLVDQKISIGSTIEYSYYINDKIFRWSKQKL